jgi:hypothetical protein
MKNFLIFKMIIKNARRDTHIVQPKSGKNKKFEEEN